MKWLMLFAFGGLGTALAVGGTWWAGSRYLIMEDGIFVTGEVVGHEESQASGSAGRHTRKAADGTFYSPIVVFQTEDGDAHRVVGTTGYGTPTPAVGTAVEVAYPPGAPERAEITSFDQAWLGPLAFVIGGIGFALLGFGGFFVLRRGDRRGDRQRREQRAARANAAPVRVVGRVVAVEKATATADARVVLVCRALQPGTGLARQYRSQPISMADEAALVGARIEMDVHAHDPSKCRVLADTLAASREETA